MTADHVYQQWAVGEKQVKAQDSNRNGAVSGKQKFFWGSFLMNSWDMSGFYCRLENIFLSRLLEH